MDSSSSLEFEASLIAEETKEKRQTLPAKKKQSSPLTQSLKDKRATDPGPKSSYKIPESFSVFEKKRVIPNSFTAI